MYHRNFIIDYAEMSAMFSQKCYHLINYTGIQKGTLHDGFLDRFYERPCVIGHLTKGLKFNNKVFLRS